MRIVILFQSVDMWFYFYLFVTSALFVPTVYVIYQQIYPEKNHDDKLAGKYVKNAVWTGDRKNTAYLFYQGMIASQVQAARYVENNTMVLTTNEKATHKRTSVNTIPREQLWVYPEIAEINKDTILGLSGRFEHWMHKINIIRNTSDKQSYIPLYKTDEFGSLHHYSLDSSKSSMGQITDIKDHRKKYNALIGQHPNINIVLYGVSRGAATTFSALAEYHYSNVKLCILEAIPSSFTGIIKNYFSKVPGLNRAGKLFYNNLTAYLFLGKQHNTDKSVQARGHVETFPVDIPLVVISSLKDSLVPLENSIRLALRVAARRLTSKNPNIQPVYFLKLNNVGHNSYTQLGSQDSKRYNDFVHAVYKKHGLPYDETYAGEGESELANANLMSEQNREFMLEQIEFWAHKELRDQIRKQAFDKLLAKKNENKLSSDQIEFYRQMPLFSKQMNNSCGFFEAKLLHSKFEELKKEAPTHSL